MPGPLALWLLSLLLYSCCCAEILYGAMGCAVLRYCMVLPAFSRGFVSRATAASPHQGLCCSSSPPRLCQTEPVGLAPRCSVVFAFLCARSSLCIVYFDLLSVLSFLFSSLRTALQFLLCSKPLPPTPLSPLPTRQCLMLVTDRACGEQGGRCWYGFHVFCIFHPFPVFIGYSLSLCVMC